MKWNHCLLIPLIPFLICGCQTVNSRDRAILQSHGVPQDVYDKMLYSDPLTLDDVVVLSQRAVPAGLIIHYMDETDSVYRLEKSDVKHLRGEGVSEEVIAYMLSTSASAPGGYPPYPYPYAYNYPYWDYPFYDAYYGPIFIGGYGRWGHGGWRGHGWGGHGGGWGGHDGGGHHH